MALTFARPSRPLPPDFRLSPRHCERSEAIQNPSAEPVWIASSQGLLAMTAERVPLAMTAGETLAPHRQRHHVIAVLDRALQHGVFQLEIETVGGANTALRRKRAAEHGAAVGEFPSLEATRDQVSDRQHRVQRALLVEHAFALDGGPGAQDHPVPM